MSEVLCGGLKKSESEFTGGLTAACGPNALAAALRWSDQSATTPGTYAVYQVGRSVSPPVDANGASTLSELEATATAAKLGYAITLPGSGEGVSAFVRRLAGMQPVVLEIANGQALRDELSGQGEDAQNLQYHYITVWGRNTGGPSGRTSKVLPAGYWCSDGDNNTQNPIVNGVRVHRTLNSDLVYYSDATLAAALPYGAFSVQARVGVPQEVYMAIPSGWHDDATTGVLTAPNGVPVVRGFRNYVLAHVWDANNWPLKAEVAVTSGSVEPGNLSVGPGSRQDFRLASLGYTTTRNVYLIWVGQDVLALETQNVALGAQVQLQQAALDHLEQQLAAAQAQLAQLQAQAGPAQALAAAVVAVVNAQSSTQKAA